MDDLIVVLTTAPDMEVAKSLARLLVEGRHAACVNLLPAVQSVYRWEGRVVEDGEVLMMAKTSRAAYPRLEAAIRQAHPYELPEIVALPALAALAEYGTWVGQSVRSDSV